MTFKTILPDPKAPWRCLICGSERSACTCLPRETPTPLERMIELWSGIEALHFRDYVHPHKDHELRRNDRLRARSQMVVAALRHYKIELEN